jgi:hypothetical protein
MDRTTATGIQKFSRNDCSTLHSPRFLQHIRTSRSTARFSSVNFHHNTRMSFARSTGKCVSESNGSETDALGWLPGGMRRDGQMS